MPEYGRGGKSPANAKKNWKISLQFAYNVHAFSALCASFITSFSISLPGGIMSYTITRRILGVILFTIILSVLLFSMSWSVVSQTQPHVPRPYLVADINTAPNSSSPANLTVMDELFFFRAQNDKQFWDIWRSDGTESGTYQVTNFLSPYNSPSQLTVLNNLLFFRYRLPSVYSTGLYVTDGTEASTKYYETIRDVGQLTAVANQLYFAANDTTHGVELWRSDGTDAGTVMVKDIHPTGSSSIASLTDVNGTLYFAANDGANGLELWRSDGTEVGTVMVKDIHSTAGSALTEFAAVDGVLFFSATDGSSGQELWRSDGTADGTVMVKDLVPGTDSGTPTALTAVNNQLFFVSGGKLWVSDGTEAGTQLLDFAPSVTPSPAQLAAFNNTLYFQADDGIHGVELWRSDGTLEGTVLVADINSIGSSNPVGLTAVNNQLFFQADGGDGSGAELWQSDGTMAGTKQVSDIYPGTASANLGQMANLDGMLYFAAEDGIHGIELWRSDGSATGTTLVKDVASGTNSAYPNYLTAGSETLYAFASDGDSRGMWATDGGEDNTRFLAETYPNDPSSYPPYYATPVAEFGAPVTVGDDLFFVNNSDGQGDELWKSDGSPTGTILINDTLSGTISFSGLYVGSLTPFNEQELMFRSSDSERGAELWFTDGTATNTHIISDIVPGSFSSLPYSLVQVGDYVYFRARNEAYGSSFWRTDGTDSGTEHLVDIPGGQYGGLVFPLTYVNGLFFFVAYHPDYGFEYWRSDGTEAGTWLLKDIVLGSMSSIIFDESNYLDFNGNFYFVADDRGDNGNELWRSDGTQENTVLFKDINPGTADSNPLQFAVANGRLFFTANDDVHGRELWISDGTGDGTNILLDINPSGDGIDYNSYGFYLPNYASLNGLYFFPANDGVHGTELWQSDGTAAGTVMVMDINSGFASSKPGNLVVLGNTLYFAADDGVHGREIWALSHAAIAEDDTVITRMGQAVGIIFLENDNYLDPDQLEIAIASQPQHGAVVLNGFTFIYTPDIGYIGVDSFIYTISDGTSEPEAATVYISVEGEVLYLPFILRSSTLNKP